MEPRRVLRKFKSSHEMQGPLLGGFPKLGYHLRSPINKDYSIWGSILGSPHFGKLPLCSRGDDLLRAQIFVKTAMHRIAPL